MECDSSVLRCHTCQFLLDLCCNKMMVRSSNVSSFHSNIHQRATKLLANTDMVKLVFWCKVSRNSWFVDMLVVENRPTNDQINVCTGHSKSFSSFIYSNLSLSTHYPFKATVVSCLGIHVTMSFPVVLMYSYENFGWYQQQIWILLFWPINNTNQCWYDLHKIFVKNFPW